MFFFRRRSEDRMKFVAVAVPVAVKFPVVLSNVNLFVVLSLKKRSPDIMSKKLLVPFENARSVKAVPSCTCKLLLKVKCPLVFIVLESERKKDVLSIPSNRLLSAAFAEIPNHLASPKLLKSVIPYPAIVVGVDPICAKV